MLVSLLEPKFLIYACIVACTGKGVHSCFKILDLRLQNLIFGSELIDLLSILGSLFECNYVFLDSPQLFDPLLGLIQLSLDLPEFPLCLLQLLPQLFVLDYEFLNELMLILELLHVDGTQLGGSSLPVTHLHSVLRVLVLFIVLLVEGLSMVLQVNDGLLSRVLGARRTERVRVEVVTATVRVIVTVRRLRDSPKRLKTRICTQGVTVTVTTVTSTWLQLLG